MTEQTLEGSPDLSVVIPVYNEEAVLPSLFSRLYPALDALGRSYEIIFIDDGSRDRSVAQLRKQYQARPEETRVVCLRANAGQHAAIIAGFEQCRGRFVVTLDADLQNPPEEIGKLLAELDKGHDYVGSIRRNRQDSAWRDIASKAMNRLRERITNIHMTDQGCMLRGYDREIINAILDSKESNTFIPALAYLYSGNPVEVVVEHEERAAGESKYPIYQLIHLNFDLMTGFSLMPLQVFSLVGVGISIVSFAFVLFLVLRRLIVGPEVEGVFTLFAIVFFLIGILLFGIGLLGEYVGRIYVQARGRPRYLVRMVLEKNGQPETGEEA
ncbi:MAG: UDP-4-amino-4-deoxy-L-arabinose-oxoglutarate aminotransferase [Gammaproteobacteria bacterium (ex Lamellibrachia satsuma)]|nr:MAG: glycosyltransferase [Gammaproteobacteria bacterium (ex Lamellibrachia satsuma)]RRS31963.1 MAG: UDP-4-amino-4-deoxy-L-arabinose-oxoglutarate aminotransferase [Gammaproteobacteria bacterium (ex Lamellibrachia satsuma)]RRS34931.1 MAG: UDP-4-amino-4-deoxy-L-arabinose-oxoglutarate aminotransferase [Gammaproteobacteria bacterium (ex Lamellibrachia satsuma)]